jgi:hypothetical protein
MIDRIVHHADVHTLKGASYRLRHLTDDALPSVRAEQTHRTTRNLVQFSTSDPGPLFEERRHWAIVWVVRRSSSA